METLLNFIGIVVWIIVSTLLRGYVLSVLWGWFVVEIFHAPTLSLPGALGISTLITLLTYQYNNHKPPEEEKNSTGVSLLIPFIMNGLALLSGWIYHQFI